ncbi:unnamed protein product, partial [Prunus brigantina]
STHVTSVRPITPKLDSFRVLSVKHSSGLKTRVERLRNHTFFFSSSFFFFLKQYHIHMIEHFVQFSLNHESALQSSLEGCRINIQKVKVRRIG